MARRTALEMQYAASGKTPAIEPELVEIVVSGDARQAAYGLAFRGREFLYRTDPDGIVRVPIGDEANRFLANVPDSRVTS
jgi:hypothetical protein